TREPPAAWPAERCGCHFDPRPLCARAHLRADARDQRSRRSIRDLRRGALYCRAHSARPLRRLFERRPLVGRAPRGGPHGDRTLPQARGGVNLALRAIGAAVAAVVGAMVLWSFYAR